MPWKWQPMQERLGEGLTEFIRHYLMRDGRVVAAVRLYDTSVRTSLTWVDPESGRLSEFLKLPSGGDTGYAGLTWHDGVLWVSYYSSHEGQTCVYLAQVRIPSRKS